MSKQIETFAAINNIFTPASTPQTPEQILEAFEETTPEESANTPAQQFSEADMSAMIEAQKAAFKKSCVELANGANALDRVALKFDKLLPPMLHEAALLGAIAKPTAQSLARLCLTTGGMKPEVAAQWLIDHKRTIARAFACIKPALIEAGVTGFKSSPAKPAIAPRQPNAAQNEPAPDMLAKPAAQPKSSPLACDVVMCLSTATEATLGAAWETMPESTKAKIMKAFQL